MTASISSAVIGLFRLSASSSFSFVRLYFLDICPFHLGFQISWHIVVCSNFYNLLYFCGISCSLSSSISDCVYLDPLSSFLDEFAQRLVIFVYLFKEPDPGFVDPLDCSFSLHVI